ncbi:hypothetical protein CN918_28150 [Priestia megaterium]|nr:hypothetical protein CN918_28150 [Priestia megaterium]
MRFLIEYKDFKSKKTTNPTLETLETFLNEHLIRTFHGSAFECIYIHFITNLPRTKKTKKLRLLYGTMAELEIVLDFIDDTSLTLDDFVNSLDKIEEAIRKASDIPVKDALFYNEVLLYEDYVKCKELAPSTQEELQNYNKTLSHRKKANSAMRIDCIHEQDKLHVRPLDKLLEECTVYDPYNLFDSLSYRYSELFSNLLRNAGVYLPGYSQIHIHIAGSLLEAKQELALEPWYKISYATIDLTTFNQSTDTQKEKMLLDSISEGLRYIADIDHLEIEKIESVISYVKEHGLDTELVYFSRSTKKVKAEIIYHVPKDHITQTEFILRATDLDTNEVSLTPIGLFDTFSVGACLSAFTIKKDEIIIKGRKSYRAELERKARNLPLEYRYSIARLFNQEIS